MSDLTDEELNILESELYQKLDKIKSEKAKRIYKEEIKDLK